MSMSPDQAAEMLRDVESTQARSRELRGYRRGSPHLILWGVVWAIAYSLSALFPALAALVWLAAVGIGVAGDAIIGWGKARIAVRWRFYAAILTLFLFVSGTYLVLPPSHPIQFETFPPLVVALAYALVGIFWLPRFLWLGALVFGLTLGGYVWLQPWFAFWMAGVGGGSLILGGLWLRSA